MRKVACLQVIIFLVTITQTFGQKVKYKDIFGLLSTKQYEAAEPFLKKYLVENQDNPNAFLFMGIIYQEKSAKDDLLKQTPRVIASMDSAIYFYNKAYQTITEKEIKRNDEYYQMYNRRDLRTGEFGVKLSDVQFDLEKRIEGLRERIDKVKMVRHYFSLSDSLYKKCNTLYRAVQAAYPGQRELYLRGDQPLTSMLKALAIRFDSSTKAFEHYKSSLVTLGKTSYNQIMALNEITDLKKDGASLANFYQDNLQVWDYGRFADATVQLIEKEIMPMRAHLLSYDAEINKLHEKLANDTVSVRSDLTALIDKLLLEQLKKFDTDPLPMEVFSLKTADLEYRSVRIEHRKQADTTNVHLQVERAQKELKLVSRLDSIATKLASEDIDRKSEDYGDFVTKAYKTPADLKAYIKEIKDFADREERRANAARVRRQESLRWVINGVDSIPLYVGVKRSKFKPVVVAEEKYTAGLVYKDSLNADGYFYTVTPARVPDVKVTFPVDKPSFKLSRLPQIKTVTYSDAAGQIYFILVYSERATKDNKYPATLAKIYRSDGLAWSHSYTLPFIPKELIFKQENGEVQIKADASQSIIDKNGKLLK
jgi:hypothetical protein